MKSCLRQDIDIIMVGELRENESIEMALTAAETGHLVLATLHTNGAVDTIDRIISVFPENKKNLIEKTACFKSCGNNLSGTYRGKRRHESSSM